MPLYTFKNPQKQLEVALYFIHIPKCGGTTLETMFEELKFNAFLAPKDYNAVRRYLTLPPTHYDIALIETLFDLSSIYSFAIVRNPYDRIISDYKWAKINYPTVFSKATFNDFCVHCFKEYINNNNYLSNHIKPQHKFISKNVNKVFKIENGLEEAIEEVLLDVGLKSNKKIVLNKINKSPEEHINISQKTKDLIYDFYKEDFKLFGYDR